MTAIARRLYLNPADPTQRYVLWTNGYIQALGGALPIALEDWQTAVGADKSPTFYGSTSLSIAALCITNWAGPTGYTLDIWGNVWPWGGATHVPGATAPATGGPEFLFGGGGGFPSPAFGYVADFVMDPGGSGKGYLLLYNGDVIGIGTGVTAVAHSAFLADVGARRIVMDWSTKDHWILDGVGRVWGRDGGATPSVAGVASPGYVWGWGGPLLTPGGMALYDTTPHGWTLDGYGRAYRIGASDTPNGYQFTPAARQWTDLGIVDDGTGPNPLRLVAMTTAGTFHEWVVSTAPTVTVLTPDDPTTTTTRPYITWSYVDTEGDAQASYEVKVFDSATYGGGGFDPNTSTPVFVTSGTNPIIRRVQVADDLPNDFYRAYVQATDTSDLASGWEYQEWEQNIAAPATPTIVATAAVDPLDGISLALHVSTVGLDPDARFAVQVSEDGGATWDLVRDGYDITPDGSGDATLVDLEAPFGPTRTYRALVYIYDPAADSWTAGTWSTSDSAALPAADIWALTIPTDPLLGGAISPSSMFVPHAATVAATFLGAGRRDPIVQSDGAPKLPSGQLSMWALDAVEKTDLEELIDADLTMLLRDPLGNARYIRRVGEVVTTTVPTSNATQETHDLSLAVQQVRRPDAGPPSGPLAEL